jgi:hypothetical protein
MQNHMIVIKAFKRKRQDAREHGQAKKEAGQMTRLLFRRQ